MADAIEASIAALESPIAGRFRRLDANRFTATLYREGQKIAGCTVFTGTGHFGADGIAYSGNDNGETNSMNENLAIEVGEGSLSLKATMSGHFGGGRDSLLTPEEGAAQLWNTLTDRLRY